MSPSPSARRPKSLVVAYALWLPLGLLGAHRFYLGRRATGLALACVTLATLLLLVVYVGLLTAWLAVGWWLVDAVLLPGMVRQTDVILTGRSPIRSR